MYALQNQTAELQVPELVLKGNCGYAIQNGRIVVNVAEIANQRAFDNLSGTLSIELWALDRPYQGTDFNGVALAGTCIGELSGQHFMTPSDFDLAFQEPPAGTWYITLMLREWNGVAYETRDFVNFDLPYTVAAKPAKVKSETANVINVSFTENKKTATVAKKASTPNAEIIKPAKKEEESKGATLSINQAGVKEIAAIKGIPKKTAENIVAARPFESFDDLSSVKGVGHKMLDKLRKLFTL
ncbi:MAG: ComEA family DNA-binding protein [Gammaproteobacteria bacterium]